MKKKTASHSSQNKRSQSMKNRNAIFTTLLLLFACIVLRQTAQAVTPAPGGGYPGANTAEGQTALLSLTTGGFNTAVGFLSLRSNTTNSFNTAIGAGTLLANVADDNTATGAGALLGNTTGVHNTANGVLSLASNSVGGDNTATGAFALQNNTNGNFNTAMGVDALFLNTTGSSNTVAGVDALFHNTAGSGNSAFGSGALASNTTAGNNTAVGYQVLLSNATGGNNTAVGTQTLLSNTTGGANTAIGYQALMNNTGDNNTATGNLALTSNTTGISNTAFGLGALGNNTTGTNNQAFGVGAGLNVTTGNGVICIYAGGANVDNSCFIGNIRGATTQNADAIPVLIDSNSQLGTASSSRRYKTDIKPMDRASESILALQPVSFRYKIHKDNTPQFGLIAEEVAEVNPNLVIYDADGKPYTVRYDAVNAMLLNEFLKEHRKVQEQEATIAELKSTIARQENGIEALTTRLNDQATQIQKVSAQMEVSEFATERIRGGGSAPQTVLNNP
jgi:uncharacterized coiled-coil protein SlyX